MSELSDEVTQTAAADEARELYELREQVEELRASLRRAVEAHRVVEIELQAARRDLDVKVAYNAMLEQAHANQRSDLASLHRHLEHLDSVSYGDLPAATARAIRAEEHLALEQARNADLARSADDAADLAAAAETELAAFRVRTSTIVGDAVASRFRRRGRVYTSAQRMLRSLGER